MRLITFICVLFFALSVNAQTQYPRGLPSPSSNGYIKEGYTQIDSGIITNVRDTFLAKYPTLIKWSGNNKYYYTNGNGAAWYPLVNNVNAGWGLIKVNDSTLKADTSINGVATWALLKKKIDSIGAVKVNYTDTASMLSHYIRTAVTSVATGFGLLGGTITTTGTLKADTSSGGLTTWALTKKKIDSLGAVKVNIADTASMLTPYVRKSSTNSILYSGSTNIGNITTGGINVTVTFPSALSTSSYFILGSIVSNGTAELDATALWVITSRSTTSFTVHFREDAEVTQNIAFEYILFAK